eukprot:UN22450
MTFSCDMFHTKFAGILHFFKRIVRNRNIPTVILKSNKKFMFHLFFWVGSGNLKNTFRFRPPLFVVGYFNYRLLIFSINQIRIKLNVCFVIVCFL